MIQPRPGQRPSILRANQQQGNKQKKRASWSDDVLLYHNPRRDSNISLPASEGTTDDSNKSNDTNEFLLRTSTCQTNFLKRISDTSNSRDSKSTTNSSITLEWWRRRAWFRVSDLRLEHMRSILSHTAYKTFIFILTLILLFGGCLQYLFPKQADPVFDIIYMVTFVMLMLDILMMCYAVPMYFVFRPSVKRKEDGDEIGCLCCDFQIGSFLLWFDVISIVSLLTEISFINTTYNERQEIQVLINQYGIPVFWESTYPLSFSNALIFTVVSRTARVARLLRIDFIGNLQSMIANLNGAIRSRKICKPLLRRTSKVSEEKKHDAASKIQRAWRVFVSSQDGGLQSIVGAFVSAGANRRANIPSHNFTTSIQSSSTSRKTGKQEEKLGMLVQSSNRDSLTKSKKRKKKKKSHIGSAMNEITMRRVAAGMMIAIVLAIFFTYMEFQSPNVVTIIAMHNTMTLLQDEDINTMQSHLEILTNIASESSTPSLCNYEFVDQNQNVELSSGNFCDIEALEAVRNLEKLHVIVCNIDNEVDRNCVGAISKSTFVFRHYARTLGVLSLIFTIFLLCLWIIGLLFFVGPVTTLVVIPIERMIRLLAMLVKDPLGYSKTKKYMTFMKEDDELAKNTMWTQASLHGMETSFLMSTILRIGSLMKVGFGSAGVEMIRSNLRKSSRTSISQGFGATVACIFMFCDIRGFTDSSECLNEEVFVFTNRIAAVVHSYCHAYGGSANKNIGDAFLLSWRLDQDPRDDKKFCANRKQADKALLSVVKICIALYHETFFLKGLSETSISALRTKFAERPPGNLVQLGFGLHAGKAVEGAIGSQRKLDATYLSEAVESSEKLESSTKKYGVNVLMSGEFYNLLHKSVKEKCRKIDDIYYSDDIDWDEQSNASGTEDKTRVRVQNHMSLHTFDMDIHALFTKNSLHSTSMTGPPASEIGKDEAVRSRQGSFRHSNDRQRSNSGVRNNSFMRRVSMFGGNVESSHLKSDRELLTPRTEVKRELEIPEGTLIYTPNVWTCDDIRTIRKRFTDEFYQRFHDGYSAYFSGDLTDAKNIFKAMVDDFQDGPSRHFLKKIKNSNDTPPPTIHFKGGR